VNEQTAQASYSDLHPNSWQRLRRWIRESPYNERTLRGRIYWGFYGKVWCRLIRLMHDLGFHYAPVKFDDEGWHRWCQQCGLRESYKRTIYRLDGKTLRFRDDLKIGPCRAAGSQEGK
jgi:hypothetical protein